MKKITIRIIPWCTRDGEARGNTHSLISFDGNGRWTGAGFFPSYKDALRASRAQRKRLRKMGYEVLP